MPAVLSHRVEGLSETAELGHKSFVFAYNVFGEGLSACFASRMW